MKALKTLTALVCLATAYGAPSESHKAVTANNEFGFALYKQIQSSNKEAKNKFVSPISAHQALSMTLNGSRRDTEVAIRKAIAASGMSTEELNRANLDLLKELNSRKDITLEIANSVWADKRAGVLESFARTAQDYYQGVARELDFSEPESAKIINRWVSEKTHGKIENVLNQTDDDFYLINATYFKGSWRYPFNEKMTRLAPFKGLSAPIPTMHSTVTTHYAKVSEGQVVELPYGERREGSMYVLLPNDLAAVEQSLDANRWSEIVDQVRKSAVHDVKLALPKFEYKDHNDLVTPLTQLGMGIAFNPMADFMNLLRSNTYLSKAFQDSYVRVDEKGTEAAAVTVIAGTTSVPFSPKAEMKVDRPFMTLITDNATGAVLFIGSVVQP